MRSCLIVFLCLVLLCLPGCSSETAFPACRVVFEENEDIGMVAHVWEVPRGGNLTVSLTIPVSRRIESVSYDAYMVSACLESNDHTAKYNLTLEKIWYPVLIRIKTADRITTSYCTLPVLEVSENSERLRINTLPLPGNLSRDGYVPVCWNTEPDGSGISVGFGSRLDRTQTPELNLYPCWLPAADAALFTCVSSDNGVTITSGPCIDPLVIPDRINGQPVVEIASGAFGTVQAETVVFPPSLQTIDSDAFSSLEVQDLWLFDGLDNVSDRSFGTYSVQTMHLNAMRSPVYCGSYFDSLSEKVDYLASVQDNRKLILFCGSSARFGYDSLLLESSFPEYRVVNMGVYAYANMRPQARLLMSYLRPGDIILSSPELDAIDCQFFGEYTFDPETFAMMESNYDMLSRIDLREFTSVFDSFAQYQQNRKGMQPRSYADIPAHYDEDGVLRTVLTYNRCGDYILHREENVDGRLFGIKRASYNVDRIRDQDWDGICEIYRDFSDCGARVFFTYAPRSSRSITSDSTPDAIALLDETLRIRLGVPVISSVDSSLMDARWFYGTDNHLCSAGAVLYTEQIISDLHAALETDQ